MKKGQSGVSLIALVITIIVVIILAAVAFGTSTRTITNANYSTFTNAVGEVRTALMERATTVKGEEAARGTSRTDAQVYNYVAKGATTNDQWLSRRMADELTATRIEPEVISDVLGLKNLNTIKVNTTKGQGIEVSYFVTKSGDVFVWPPYEYEDKYYVNDDKTITVAENAADDSVTNTEIDFGGGVKVGVSNTATPATKAVYSNSGDLKSLKTVYYLDKAGAAQPQGAETGTANIFSDGSI